MEGAGSGFTPAVPRQAGSSIRSGESLPRPPAQVSARPPKPTRRWLIFVLMLGLATLAVGTVAWWCSANWTESSLRAEIARALPAGSSPAAARAWAQSHHFQIRSIAKRNEPPGDDFDGEGPPLFPPILGRDYFYVEFFFDEEHKLKDCFVEERRISF